MTDKPEPKDAKKDAKEPRPIIHLGMMGDGTEEQNLGDFYGGLSALRSWLTWRLYGDPSVRGQAGDQLMRGIIDVDADPIDERHPFGVRLDALGGEFGRLWR